MSPTLEEAQPKIHTRRPAAAEVAADQTPEELLIARYLLQKHEGDRQPEQTAPSQQTNSARFAADIALQLVMATKRSNPTDASPSQLLKEIVRFNGFRIQEADLGRDCDHTVDSVHKIAFVSNGADGEQHSLRLAKCIAHIRIASATAGLDCTEYTRLTNLYARTLLLAAAQLEESLERAA